MKNASPKKSTGFSWLDLLLLVAILGSIGFIGSRILESSGTKNSFVKGSLKAIESLSPIATPSVSPNTPIIPTLEDHEWKKIISDPILNSARAKRTDGCAAVGNVLQWGFWTSNAARIQQIHNNSPQTLWGLKDFQCFEVDQVIPLVSFSDKPTEPVVQYLSSMKVADIISIEIRKIPASYYASQNSSVALFEEYLSTKRQVGPGVRDNIIRLVPLAGTPAPKPDEYRAPAIARYGKVIHKKAQAALLASLSNPVIVDIRSAAEFAKGSLPNAINVPFTPAPLKTPAFSWNVKNSDLIDSEFDVSQIYPKYQGRPIVIVGGPPTDGRAFWSVNFLSSLTDGHLYFLYDGV